mmetsp:Transcript_56157/g.89388  ORF Transcript_56157/g.89388 Transcript_56157/m.89388 type:complete len:93 (-) Transcript_56157:676-954(-)
MVVMLHAQKRHYINALERTVCFETDYCVHNVVKRCIGKRSIVLQTTCKKSKWMRKKLNSLQNNHRYPAKKRATSIHGWTAPKDILAKNIRIL